MLFRSGVLQQIDTPQNLYDLPNNKFVAGFIGSPAMNFFDAKVIKDGSGYLVDAGSFKVKAPKKHNKAYGAYEGKSVTLGIRPEDIHSKNFQPAEITPSPVDAEVEVIELMGNEIVAYLKAGDQNFVARVDPRSDFKVGDKANMVFNIENIHLFDKDTEEAIR